MAALAQRCDIGLVRTRSGQGLAAFALVAGLALLVAYGAALGVEVDSATAARPVKGALYADTDYASSVEPQVSGSGRWLSPRRSYVDVDMGAECDGGAFHLGTRKRPIGIRRSGRFRYVRRRGRFELRVRGRFRTKDRATIAFRYIRRPRRRHHPCDDSGRIKLAPMRVRRYPFRGCRTHPAETLLSAPTGRVFWQSEWDGTEWLAVTYACLFSANKRFKLHVDGDDDSDLHDFRLVGPYVAYAWHPCAEGCHSEDVEVKDLRDGRLARRAAYGLLGNQGGAVTDLELKPNASVGVIAYGDPYAPRLVPEVWAYDAMGSSRKLDRGNISRRSLVLNGSTLTWVKDGVVRSGTLH
jgi:hypothetical protein